MFGLDKETKEKIDLIYKNVTQVDYFFKNYEEKIKDYNEKYERKQKVTQELMNELHGLAGIVRSMINEKKIQDQDYKDLAQKCCTAIDRIDRIDSKLSKVLKEIRDKRKQKNDEAKASCSKKGSTSKTSTEKRCSRRPKAAKCNEEGEVSVAFSKKKGRPKKVSKSEMDFDKPSDLRI